MDILNDMGVSKLSATILKWPSFLLVLSFIRVQNEHLSHAKRKQKQTCRVLLW